MLELLVDLDVSNRFGTRVRPEENHLDTAILQASLAQERSERGTCSRRVVQSAHKGGEATIAGALEEHRHVLTRTRSDLVERERHPTIDHALNLETPSGAVELRHPVVPHSKKLLRRRDERVQLLPVQRVGPTACFWSVRPGNHSILRCNVSQTLREVGREHGGRYGHCATSTNRLATRQSLLCRGIKSIKLRRCPCTAP